MSESATSAPARNRRTLWLLSILALGMFGFGFAMVPLYNLLCQVTGVQSVELRTRVDAPLNAPVTPGPVTERQVTVKFDATVNPNLPWDFAPLTNKIKVQPGKTYRVSFMARNRSSRTVVGQAIPSIVPWQATGYFHKLECFCFSRQTLKGGEEEEMPLQFTVSPDLPAGINSLTLSYTFMNTGSVPETARTTASPGDIAGRKI